MDELSIVRSLLLRIGLGVAASTPMATAIAEWAQPHMAWLSSGGEALTPEADERPHALVLADELAALLSLEPFDARLLTIMIACDRLPRVTGLAAIAVKHGHALPRLLGEIAGAEANDAERLVRQSPALRLGLIGFAANRAGEVTVDVRWTLERVLDRAPAAGQEMIDGLVGARQPATLSLDDFAHVADADILIRLLRGAATERAAGINILIHGPPGTGKTEFARMIADAAGLTLHGVGEADSDGSEPNRWERIDAISLAQRLLGARGDSVLLFDEMEDLIGNAAPSGGDWFSRREGSKVFVNRLLETNPAPVIWTTNAIGNIDGAILRRMSFVLKMDLPSRNAALRMLDRIAADEDARPAERLAAMIDVAPETATILRTAIRAGRLAGTEDGGARPAETLVGALRGRDMLPDGPGEIDLSLFETDIAIDPLFAAIRDSGGGDISLLLTGPPGTGKTAIAYHLARALDRPLIVKRASDLLSKWVGETEAAIAAAFAEARGRGGVLLFDEADSLLFDRTTARNSWEVGQVNELLTWLDRHPLPVVAATNHPGQLDPATLRRFVFKLAMRPLGRERARKAFALHFDREAPAELDALTNLTPGDFAVVARQIRWLGQTDARGLVERLRAEAAAKPDARARIGF